MMQPEVHKIETDYEAAPAHLDTLMDAAPGSPQEAELERFTLLIEGYEQAHHPIDLPDPEEAIRFRMEQQGLRQNDIVACLGSQSKVSEDLHTSKG
jgi:HTH-type transcriptional regulator/antitoxin HigA